MKLNRQQQILNEIAAIHAEWEREFEDQVEMNWDHSKPHYKETGATDYNQHHVAVSASTEQEKVFQDRIAALVAELEAITESAPSGPVTAAGGPEAGDEGDGSTSIDFDLVVNGDLVLMLVKHDFEEGTLSYREGGNWINVQPGQELPALDDNELTPVTGQATPIWDAAEGGELTVDSFKDVLLGSTEE